MAQALIEFENVLAMEPQNFVGDDFSRITQTYRVTQYNIACCYAAMGQVRWPPHVHCSLCSVPCHCFVKVVHGSIQVDAGLDALSGALAAGYDDFRTVRTDSSLDSLRKNKKFKTLVDNYDPPFINEGAIKCAWLLSVLVLISECELRTERKYVPAGP